MPNYELEITNPDGGDPAQRTLASDESYDVGDTFDHEGAILAVTAVNDPDNQSFDAKLVCSVEGGRPHYF
jgi:hypothetical protein